MGRSVSGSNSPGSFSSNVSFSGILPPSGALTCTSTAATSLILDASLVRAVSVVLLLVNFVPSHLDCLEFGLRRFRRLVVKFVAIDHPLTQVSKPRVKRIEPRMILREHFGDLFRLIPFQSHLT